MVVMRNLIILLMAVVLAVGVSYVAGIVADYWKAHRKDRGGGNRPR